MTRIASHRGGTLEFGDSTPDGFKATAKMTLDEVEFDVHPTADGLIIVHHDATLDRTTDTKGAIADLTGKEVLSSTINFSRGGHPLQLSELCTIFKQSKVQLRCEFKPDANRLVYKNFVPHVIDTLVHNECLEKTYFTSFLIDFLDEVGSLCSRPRLWLVSPLVLTQLGVKGVIEIVKSHQIEEIGVHIDKASPELMDSFCSQNITFGCWAAHSRAQIAKALSMGVSVFTSDRPSLAIAMREEFLKGQSQ